MTQVNLPNKESNPGKAEWPEVYGNDKAIADVVNGELENDNIAAGADIAGSKLADSSIPVGKLDSKFLWGRVSGGEKLGGSEGWSVAKVSAGLYKITISPALATTATCTFSVAGTPERRPLRVEAASASKVELFFVNLKDEVADSDFHFTIFG